MRDKQNLIPAVLAAANLLVAAALGYGLSSMNTTLTDRIARVESSNHQAQSEGDRNGQATSETEKKIADLTSDLELIKERIGVTSNELHRAREIAQTLKRQQEQAAKELASQLATKANSTDIDVLRQEATNKIAEVQQDSNNKFGNVSGELTGIRQDLVASREDWNRQLVDVRNALSERIARNSSELAELRKKGERDYFEFDIRNNSKQPLNRVGDIQLALLKTDAKKHKYNLAIQVDDHRLEKKDRTANEPVQFLVGRDQLRYEVVVNSVEKDRIRGYLSAPKDKVPAAETPRFRVQ